MENSNFIALLKLFGVVLILSTNFANVQSEDRIVGGSLQNVAFVPYQVLLFPAHYYCGGSLLTEHWIVTAAHCTKDLSASDIVAAVGVQVMSEVTSVYAIDWLIQYPYYDPVTQDNDISLLKTQVAIAFSQKVQPIMLQSFVPPDGSIVKISGYGHTQFNGTSSDALLSANINIMNFATCNEKYNNLLTDNMICAGVANYKIDTCQGDSGGPLVYNGKLLGVVSFGTGCAWEGYSGVYTSVPRYLDWINYYLQY